MTRLCSAVSLCLCLLGAHSPVAASSYSIDHDDNACRATTRLLTGWTACRIHNVDQSNIVCRKGNELKVASIPTTALVVLLDNGAIPNISFSSEDLYMSTNLAKLPDLDTVDRDYYTLLYQIYLPPYNKSSSCYVNATQRVLRFAGINYRVRKAYINGNPIDELRSSDEANTDGMFRRRSFAIPLEETVFSIIIEPPLHPGTARQGGQGGDHALAQDGPTAQYNLGWDWCQAMPDRATGFFGAAQLLTTGPVAIMDPTIQTLHVECGLIPSSCTKIDLRVLVRLECIGDVCDHLQEGTVLQVKSEWGNAWSWKVVLQRGITDLRYNVTVQRPERVRLWWPHGLGVPHAQLSKFNFSIHLSNSSNNQHNQHSEIVSTAVSDERDFRTGIRIINTYLDETTQGQTFLVNGHRIFLVGGNWIGTDQALRYSASKERYCHELLLHKHAGLNLIRVWGGGIAERDEFYECADELGLLVFQEFWMTGDNNGRWAGNYSWPLNWTTYLTNVQDTVRRLRPHPSLLFYGGCNECAAPLNFESKQQNDKAGRKQ